MEGFLTLKNGSFSFIRVWVLLDGQQLTCYDQFDQETQTPKKLRTTAVIRDATITKFQDAIIAIGIKIKTPRGKIVFTCPDQNTCSCWCNALARANTLHLQEENKDELPKKYASLLGIEDIETMSKATIARAYKRASLKEHPDKGGDPNKFHEIHEAYQFLLNRQNALDETDNCHSITYDVLIEKLKGIGMGISVTEDKLRNCITVNSVNEKTKFLGISEESLGSIQPGDILIGLDNDDCSQWTLLRLKARLDNQRVPIGSQVLLIFERRIPNEHYADYLERQQAWEAQLEKDKEEAKKEKEQKEQQNEYKPWQDNTSSSYSAASATSATSATSSVASEERGKDTRQQDKGKEVQKLVELARQRRESVRMMSQSNININTNANTNSSSSSNNNIPITPLASYNIESSQQPTVFSSSSTQRIPTTNNNSNSSNNSNANKAIILSPPSPPSPPLPPANTNSNTNTNSNNNSNNRKNKKNLTINTNTSNNSISNSTTGRYIPAEHRHLLYSVEHELFRVTDLLQQSLLPHPRDDDDDAEEGEDEEMMITEKITQLLMQEVERSYRHTLSLAQYNEEVNVLLSRYSEEYHNLLTQHAQIIRSLDTLQSDHAALSFQHQSLSKAFETNQQNPNSAAKGENMLASEAVGLLRRQLQAQEAENSQYATTVTQLRQLLSDKDRTIYHLQQQLQQQSSPQSGRRHSPRYTSKTAPRSPDTTPRSGHPVSPQFPISASMSGHSLSSFYANNGHSPNHNKRHSHSASPKKRHGNGNGNGSGDGSYGNNGNNGNNAASYEETCEEKVQQAQRVEGFLRSLTKRIL